MQVSFQDRIWWVRLGAHTLRSSETLAGRAPSSASSRFPFNVTWIVYSSHETTRSVLAMYANVFATALLQRT